MRGFQNHCFKNRRDLGALVWVQRGVLALAQGRPSHPRLGLMTSVGPSRDGCPTGTLAFFFFFFSVCLLVFFNFLSKRAKVLGVYASVKLMKCKNKRNNILVSSGSLSASTLRFSWAGGGGAYTCTFMVTLFFNSRSPLNSNR